ncbi:MAG TPA: AIR synthase related protein [Crinalium sp.]
MPPCTPEGIEIRGTQHTWNDVLLQLLASPTIASKRWVYRQYDHQVQNNTVMLPGGADAAIVRIRPHSPLPTPHSLPGVAATVDCNPRYVYLHPYEGAKAAVAEAARNLSCVGAEPIAVTDNLNFGSPEKPIGYWQLAEACRGLAEACKEFSTPVTGGNVSLYNETLDAEGKPQPIYPTPVVGMVGLIPDLTKIAGQGWQAEGDIIYLLGAPVESSESLVSSTELGALGNSDDPELKTQNSKLLTLGGSEYLAVVHGTIAGIPPIIDFDLERRVQSACREGIRQGWIRSAHDCAEGGLAVALAESCLSGGRGAAITLDPVQLQPSDETRWDHLLFAEGGARIVVSVAPNHVAQWEMYLMLHLDTDWGIIGQVGDQKSALQIAIAATSASSPNKPLINLALADMGDRWHNAIERGLTP